MAWDPTKPAEGAALQSAVVRGNFAALDAAIMAALAAGPAQSLLLIAAGGVAGKINPGTAGYVLTMVAGVPTWVALPVDPGFPNPMTTAGDVIVGGASGAPARLAVGTAGYVLTIVAGAPAWAAAAAGGATVVRLPLALARFPDGTAGNLFPQPTDRVSTGTPATGVPKLVELVYQFDATAIEWLIWTTFVPASYAGGALTLIAKWSMATATAGNIRIQAALGAVVDDSTDVRALVTPAPTVSADLAVPATLGQQKETRLTLTGLSNVAAGRRFDVAVSLYAGGASSATGDRVLESLALEFA